MRSLPNISCKAQILVFAVHSDKGNEVEWFELPKQPRLGQVPIRSMPLNVGAAASQFPKELRNKKARQNSPAFDLCRHRHFAKARLEKSYTCYHKFKALPVALIWSSCDNLCKQFICSGWAYRFRRSDKLRDGWEAGSRIIHQSHKLPGGCTHHRDILDSLLHLQLTNLFSSVTTQELCHSYTAGACAACTKCGGCKSAKSACSFGSILAFSPHAKRVSFCSVHLPD